MLHELVTGINTICGALHIYNDNRHSSHSSESAGVAWTDKFYESIIDFQMKVDSIGVNDIFSFDGIEVEVVRATISDKTVGAGYPRYMSFTGNSGITDMEQIYAIYDLRTNSEKSRISNRISFSEASDIMIDNLYYHIYFVSGPGLVSSRPRIIHGFAPTSSGIYGTLSAGRRTEGFALDSNTCDFLGYNVIPYNGLSLIETPSVSGSISIGYSPAGN